ncbi:hypothetical protein ACIBHX_45045 [Nonomuraea sp. NPDC050536]
MPASSVSAPSCTIGTPGRSNAGEPSRTAKIMVTRSALVELIAQQYDQML